MTWSRRSGGRMGRGASRGLRRRVGRGFRRRRSLRGGNRSGRGLARRRGRGERWRRHAERTGCSAVLEGGELAEVVPSSIATEQPMVADAILTYRVVAAGAFVRRATVASRGGRRRRHAGAFRGTVGRGHSHARGIPRRGAARVVQGADAGRTNGGVAPRPFVRGATIPAGSCGLGRRRGRAGCWGLGHRLLARAMRRTGRIREIGAERIPYRRATEGILLAHARLAERVIATLTAMPRTTIAARGRGWCGEGRYTGCRIGGGCRRRGCRRRGGSARTRPSARPQRSFRAKDVPALIAAGVVHGANADFTGRVVAADAQVGRAARALRGELWHAEKEEERDPRRGSYKPQGEFPNPRHGQEYRQGLANNAANAPTRPSPPGAPTAKAAAPCASV